MAILSLKDVESLVRDPSSATRVETAGKLARDFVVGGFSSGEFELAIQIFRIMMKDAEIRVRQALSEHLKASTTIPRDVAKALADDVDLVALPMLEHSHVLTADDLVDLINRQRSQAKMLAITARPMLQGKVTAALAQHGDESVVAAMVSNPGAVMEGDTLDVVVDRFGGSQAVNTSLADRADLPVRIAERLTALVSEQLREHLIKRHRLGPDTAMELVLATRERATLSIARDFSESGVAALAAQLRHAGRLTPSLIFRAACMGHRVFFENALAQLAEMPVANAVILMRDPNGFKNLWTRAGMPAPMLPAAAAAIDAVRDMEAAGRDLDAEEFSRRVIERVMTQYETFGVEFERDDLEYLFARVAKLTTLGPSPPANDQAG